MGIVAPGSDGFLAAYRAARTPTDHYRCRLEVTASAAPQEVLELLREADGLPRPERRWLQELAAHLTAEVPDVRVFERSDLHAAVRLYRDRSSDPSAPRTLLIAFGGKAHRLMLHTPVFLQHLPPEPYDVLFVIDPVRDAFRSGIPGLASDFAGLIDWIRSIAGTDWTRLQTLGTSMGGGPALVAAHLLGAERGVCVGGALEPEDADAALRTVTGGAGVDARRPTAASGLLAVFAAGNERDAGKAAEIAEWLPGLVRVEVRPASDHAVLEEARRHGRLAALFALLLTDPVPLAAGRSEPAGDVVRFALPSSARWLRSWVRLLPGRSRRVGSVARRVLETGLRQVLDVLPVRPSAKDRLAGIAYDRAGLMLASRSRRRRRP